MSSPDEQVPSDETPQSEAAEAQASDIVDSVEAQQAEKVSALFNRGNGGGLTGAQKHQRLMNAMRRRAVRR